MTLSDTCPPTLELRCGPLSSVDLALYAAASGDHNPLHLDDEVARAAGFDRPVVHGMLSMACAARLFSAHFGTSAVQVLSTRFTGIALRGDCLLIQAQLIECTEASAIYRLSACTDRGTEVLSGTARVALVAGAGEAAARLSASKAATTAPLQ